MPDLTLAVIGLGMGRHHVGYFCDNPDVKRVVVVDRDPARIERAREAYKLDAAYSDYKEMLKAEKPDGCSVALPNKLHAPVTIDCLKAGAHVICEKPMAMNTREAKRMNDTAAKADRVLMIHFNHRFKPELRYLKKLIDEGLLGDIYYAKTRWHRRRGIPGGNDGWFMKKEHSGGGPLIDLGVHRLDIALFMMGYPEPVSVSGATFNHLGRTIKGEAYDVEDLASGYVRFDNGAVLFVEASWASNSENRESFGTELFGTKGGAVQQNIGEGYETEMKVFVEQAGQCVEMIAKDLEREKPQGPAIADHFVDCVLGRCQPLCPGDHGLKVMRIIDGLYKSAELGKEVKV